jgi:precorrin-8X/cobalt-precorrin-8 methylmutase
VIHPIEAESFELLHRRVDLSGWPRPEREVVARVVHASADVEYASTMWVSPGAVEAGVAALRSGAPLVADVEMVRHGITGVRACCHLPDGADEADEDPAGEGLTRAARGMRAAAWRHPDGAVVVVGCAPTALVEVVRLAGEGGLRPALVVGMPVGFVGAAEAKAALRASGLPAIGNTGEKGGSAVAAAAVNAKARLAGGPEEGGAPA